MVCFYNQIGPRSVVLVRVFLLSLLLLELLPNSDVTKEVIIYTNSRRHKITMWSSR